MHNPSCKNCGKIWVWWPCEEELIPIEPVPGDGILDVEIPAGGGFKIVHTKLITDTERWLRGGR